MSEYRQQLRDFPTVFGVLEFLFCASPEGIQVPFPEKSQCIVGGDISYGCTINP